MAGDIPIAECKTCKFAEKVNDDFMMCRRYPRPSPPHYQPLVDPRDWCGEYRDGPSFREYRP